MTASPTAPAPRPLTGIDVEFTCAGRTARARGNLLGVGALLLETRQQLPDDTEVELCFRPTPGSPVISARGVVSRQVPGEGLGVRITDLAEEHREHILQLLYPPGPERRASKRVSFVTQIRTAVGGKMLVGYSKNISTGGIFIETEDPAEKGAELSLRFKLAPESGILETRAVVAYAVPGEGMGLRFLDVSPVVREQIEAFVNEQEA